MKANFKSVALIAITLIIFTQIVLLRMDDRANQDFADKATTLNLKGKNKKFVQSQFGTSYYTYRSDKDEIWVYTPGPILAIWNSECKIGFDIEGLVTSWMVRSD